MRNWREKAAKLRDYESMKSLLRTRTIDFPDYCSTRSKLLSEYFLRIKGPSDICIVLYSGLEYAYLLAEHLKGNNLLFYRPAVTYSKRKYAPFLEEAIDPEHPLLLFDEDILTGKALRETADHFEKLDYDRSRILAYVDSAFWIDFDSSKCRPAHLMQVDELLRINEEMRKLNKGRLK